MPTTSRLAQVRLAVRPALKARMMISAPSGAGKTRTALTIATELAEGARILGIDTEKESMLTYADDFVFEHLPWAAPFAPQELTEVLGEVGEYSVVIVDSATHFWRMEGGTLDIANGKFTGWKEARPVQEALVQAILACPAHVILCVRSDMAYEQTEDSSGKKHVERVGMKPQQDGDLVYELNVGLDMDMNHNIVVTKTRTAVLPINRTFRPGRAGVVELARTYKEWLAGGEPLLGKAEVEALIEMFNDLPGTEDRKIAKRLFVEQFARPEMLRASQLDDAERWIKDYVARGGPEVDPVIAAANAAADAGGSAGDVARAALDAHADELLAAYDQSDDVGAAPEAVGEGPGPSRTDDDAPEGEDLEDRALSLFAGGAA